MTGGRVDTVERDAGASGRNLRACALDLADRNARHLVEHVPPPAP